MNGEPAGTIFPAVIQRRIGKVWNEFATAREFTRLSCARLPRSTAIYFGGAEATQSSLEAAHKEEFVKYIDNPKLGPAEWMKDALNANYACARDPRAACIPADSPACELKGTLVNDVNQQPVKSVTAEDLRTRMEARENAVLPDAREPAELSSELGHLPGIRNVPISEVSKRLGQLAPFEGQTIVTMCRPGGRAHTAAQILGTAGFKNVLVLAGGMVA
jgi:rhodanese-related sulfurtransferase